MSVLREVILADQKTIYAGYLQALAQVAPHYAGADRAVHRKTLAGILKALAAHSSTGQTSAAFAGWAEEHATETAANGCSPNETMALVDLVARLIRASMFPAGANARADWQRHLESLEQRAAHLRGALADVLARGSTSSSATSAAFNAIVERIPDLVALVSTSGEIVYVNASGRRWLPGDEGTPLPSIAELHSPSTAVKLMNEALPKALDQGEWHGSGQLRSASDETLEVEISISRMDDIYPGETLLAVIERDVHERKRAAESEAWKNAILESSLDPIISVNHLGVITDFNAAAERVFGHPRSHVISKKPEDVLFPAEDEGQKRIDRNLSAGAGSMLGTRNEVPAVRANGEVFPAEMAMTISRVNSRPVFTFFLRDITRRKQNEAQIRSLARFPDENPNPMLRIAEDGKVLYANEASEPVLRLWDCEPQQKVPESFRGLIGKVLSAGKMAEIEVECGAETFSFVLTPVVDARYVNLYGRNVSSRKQAEQALRESEALYHSLVETLPVNLFRKDSEGRFTFVNRRFCETLPSIWPRSIAATIIACSKGPCSTTSKPTRHRPASEPMCRSGRRRSTISRSGSSARRPSSGTSRPLNGLRSNCNRPRTRLRLPTWPRAPS
jgi:PAS domain S-box-containing protein